jgi:hypothetical protein
MKTRSFILAVLAMTFALAPSTPNTALARGTNKYTARLVSPKAGDVLRPGQVVRIEWAADYPDVDLDYCEMEILLSTDGGRVYKFVTEQRNPKIQFYNWTVPATPTRTAILDIRFGCLGLYPETTSPQPQSTFVISAD